MDYTITSVKGEYPSNYPDSKKYLFRVEGYDHELSAFSKFPMKVGDKITGEIVPNGQWHNFKWSKKTSAPAGDLNRIEMIIRRNHDEVMTKLGVLHGIMTRTDKDALNDMGTGWENETPQF